jgi:thiamine pyrophosphokinase
MRIVIIANGWLNQPLQLQPDEILIAADGGARHCLELGLTPRFVIGDLDSLDDSHLQKLTALGSQIVRYPARKDFTDLELAIQYALKLGATEIVIQAALGARWDQTIANLLLPAAFTGVHVHLVDGNQEIHLVRDAEELLLHGQPGDTVSLISLSPQTRGITTQNLEYPLQDETLYLGSTRGVSNVLLDKQAKIYVKEGLLLCTIIHVREKTP